VPAAVVLLAAGAEVGDDFWRGYLVKALPRDGRAALLGEAAWARRGHLCCLRRRVNPNSEQAAADESKAAAVAAAVAGVAGGTGGTASSAEGGSASH
jgi:hypothetical protein